MHPFSCCRRNRGAVVCANPNLEEGSAPPPPPPSTLHHLLLLDWRERSIPFCLGAMWICRNLFKLRVSPSLAPAGARGTFLLGPDWNQDPEDRPCQDQMMKNSGYLLLLLLLPLPSTLFHHLVCQQRFVFICLPSLRQPDEGFSCEVLPSLSASFFPPLFHFHGRYWKGETLHVQSLKASQQRRFLH